MARSVEVYTQVDGKSPFNKWFDELNSFAAAKVTVAIKKMEYGNFSNSKALGAGIWENKIDFGPGYRVYYGKEGDEIIILLAGGTKKRQQRDIEVAKELWAEYKRRKRGRRYATY